MSVISQIEPKSAPIGLMAHLVSDYPSTAIALAAAQGLAEGGVSYFEVQFPFSDPSADGKAIQTACSEVLSQGWRLDRGFAFVAALHGTYPSIPVYIMTYGNLAYRQGIETFVRRSAESGAAGLIVPDLPFDSDEGLNAACEKYGLVSVPVAAPSMSSQRLSALAALRRPFVYAALRAGITGSETVVDASTVEFIHSVSISGSKVLGGFGIRTGEQSAKLAPHVHAVVAGSVFVDLIREKSPSGEGAVREAVSVKSRELTGL
jgi:tryptophan synthase alpha chain